MGGLGKGTEAGLGHISQASVDPGGGEVRETQDDAEDFCLSNWADKGAGEEGKEPAQEPFPNATKPGAGASARGPTAPQPTVTTVS